MKDINELRRKKTAKITAARKFDADCTKGGRQMTPDEMQQFEELTNEVRALNEEIHREELNQAEEMGNSLEGPAGFRMAPGVELPGCDAPVGNTRVGMAAKDKTYRGMFHSKNPRIALDRGSFQSTKEFLEVIASGRYDGRLQKRTMIEGTPSAGGFAVPEEMAAEWFDGALESEVIRPRATVWPMSSQTRNVPAWDDADHSSSEIYGGLSISWLAEAGTATRQTPKLRLVTLTAKKGAIFVAASRELMQDGIDFDTQLENALFKSLGWGLDDAFLNGDGAGKPLGILNSDSIIEISKETGQEADTVIYDNLRKMEARLLPKCMLRAVWIANNSTFPQLSMLSQEVGMGGTALKALTRQNNQYYLLDRPISFTEKAPALGDAGDIVLADLSMYYIGMRQEILMDMSNAPGWITDTIDFRVICRVDGLPILSQAFTPKNGDSLSWAVKIEARA